MNNIPTNDKLTEMYRAFSEARMKNFINVDFLSLNWWILLLIFIVPWIIWYKLVHQERLIEVLLYGSIVYLFINYIDAIGSELLLWTYPTKFIPFLPRLVPLNVSLFTVLYMLIYQYSKNWKSYIITHLISSAISAFVGLPILNWLGINNFLKWNYFYSYLVLIGIALISRWLINLCLNTQHKAISNKV